MYSYIYELSSVGGGGRGRINKNVLKTTDLASGEQTSCYNDSKNANDVFELQAMEVLIFI